MNEPMWRIAYYVVCFLTLAHLALFAVTIWNGHPEFIRLVSGMLGWGVAMLMEGRWSFRRSKEDEL